MPWTGESRYWWGGYHLICGLAGFMYTGTMGGVLGLILGPLGLVIDAAMHYHR